MRATGLFAQLAESHASSGPLRILFEGGGKAAVLHLHRSNYGKFERQLQVESREIASLLERGGV